MKWLSHMEGWQSCYPAGWGPIATCSVQAMDGEGGKFGFMETWALFFSYLQSYCFRSFRFMEQFRTHLPNCWGSAVGIPSVRRHRRRPSKMPAAPGRELPKWVPWLLRDELSYKRKECSETEREKMSEIGFKWKSDVHLNLFQLCLECLMHLNFQV